MKHRFWKQLTSAQRSHSGFALVEIIVVIVIISILTAVAVPILIEQRRQAIIATVQSDVKSSVGTIVAINNNEVGFIDPEDFLDTAAVTGDNNLMLVLNGKGEGTVACVWGSHVFSNNDIVSYHYSSSTGKVMEGGCIGYESTIVVGKGPDFEDEHSDTPTPTPTPTPTATPTSTPPTTTPTPGNTPAVTPTPTSTPVVTPTNSPTSTPTPTQPPVVTPTPTPTPTNPTITQPTPTPSATPKPTVTPAPPVKEPVIVPSGTGNRAKYPVCHFSGGSWHLIMIAKAGVINGHAGHPMDVIPPIANAYSGNNWDASGWQTFNKYCS